MKGINSALETNPGTSLDLVTSAGTNGKKSDPSQRINKRREGLNKSVHRKLIEGRGEMTRTLPTRLSKSF
jgi:hypothetical protein